jgi:DNA-binding NtrC family response regulator
MRRLLSVLDRLRRSELPVLIQGETGSGKELIARTIHAESRRHTGPFRVLEASAIPLALIEAELFGARAGAFTDLTEDRPGLLRMAAGGTLFIDDAAGLPLEAQAKLLRVLSGGAIRPLGGEEEVKVDVRFVVSTARDLEAEVSAGRLRADLHHRLRIATLVVPPLRERPEDFPELVAALLAEGGGSRLKIGAAAMDALKAMPWPGNVRELRNFLARLRLEGAREVTAGDVERAAEAHRTATVLPRNLLAQESLPALKKRLERDYLAHHFRRVGGEATALARFLAVTRRQLYRRCERLGFNLREERRRIRAERGDVKES